MPSCTQTVHAGDTVNIYSVLLSTNRYGSILFSLNPGNPNTPTQGTPVSTLVGSSGLLGMTSFSATGLIPGTYSWTVQGKDAAGYTIGGQQSLIVLPALVKVNPIPRTVTSITFSIGSTPITLPAAGIKFTYADGTTQ